VFPDTYNFHESLTTETVAEPLHRLSNSEATVRMRCRTALL
jgi:hypothetical protein